MGCLHSSSKSALKCPYDSKEPGDILSAGFWGDTLGIQFAKENAFRKERVHLASFPQGPRALNCQFPVKGARGAEARPLMMHGGP